MSLIIKRYRIGEEMVWYEDLNDLLAQPTDSALKLHVTRVSTWVGLLYEINLLQSAFTQMLLSDQATAVDLFEIDTVVKYHRNDDQEMVPVEVEMVRACFPAPFLASAFDIAWRRIKDADIEPVAIYELKRVTVHRIPGQWIREDRNGDSTFAVTTLLKGRQDQCDVCREFAHVPFQSCWYCNDSPCYHHGRCCPSRRDWPAASASSRPVF